ncbi:TPA: rod shape-determining protein MreC [Streptococcus suis]|uniref:rod shape-determining protein MreC n=1 Tax=Streptococcus suis TaxID=1307 RepID=UPI000CF6A209|nr:rod shape-determining protein MreC [Streptococcus suis]MBY4986834.1 rod shape-determining protein MreC [Streptococcus suis]MBY5039957.1 rod shape-determining protein MreC [Streptococcus suis]MCK3882263.1 rod shape-determining protein MreC [Streptococcus suis]MDW8681573.1 rod shape-determining protein MreC [Streptococcus suis]MDW8759657.1 rod shape-determining protein MreC [Streptococcus suis]
MNKLSKLIIVFSTFLFISFSLLFVTLSQAGNLSFLKEGVNFFISPFQSMFSIPTRFLSEQKSIISDLLLTYEENKELRKLVRDLESLSFENSTLKSENLNLRNNLDFTSSFPTNDFVPGSVLVRNPSSWSSNLSINIGMSSGIEVDDLVVANGGLIGTVKDVSSNSSDVRLITSSDEFRKIAVKILTDSGEIYGILSGYDSDSNSFVINQLSSNDEISTGSNVVTSDLAGATPANIQIGKVSSVVTDSKNMNKEVFIEPSASFSNIYSVLVVRQSNE